MQVSQAIEDDGRYQLVTVTIQPDNCPSAYLVVKVFEINSQRTFSGAAAFMTEVTNYISIHLIDECKNINQCDEMIYLALAVCEHDGVYVVSADKNEVMYQKLCRRVNTVSLSITDTHAAIVRAPCERPTLDNLRPSSVCSLL